MYQEFTLEEAKERIERNYELGRRLSFRMIENLSQFSRHCHYPMENTLILSDSESERMIVIPKDFAIVTKALIDHLSDLDKIHAQYIISLQNFPSFPQITSKKQ